MLSWEVSARPKQLEPSGYWLIWLIRTGRGWGKNTTAARTVIKKVKKGEARNIALVAPTVADARDMMVDESRQNSGILSNSTPDFMPKYVPSKRRLEWPNGAVATTFSAEDPDQLRGPNIDLAWCDELAAWKPGNRELTWDNLMFTLRRGLSQCIITTTPRPIILLKKIMQREGCVLTTGSTYENLHNLSPAYISNVIKPYEGTHIGRQEIYGDLLEDNDFALFDMDTIDKHRIKDVNPFEFMTTCDKVVVAVDPTGSKTGHGVGIVIGGGIENKGYLLGDYSLPHATPNQWAKRAILAYDDYDANYIIVERNFGGDMVANTVRLVAKDMGHDPIPIREVSASRGKALRAEPVSGINQQGKVFHVGEYDALEDQLYALETGESDDRADGYVWVMTDLLLHRVRRVRPQAGDAKGIRPNRDLITHTVVGNLWNQQW